MLKTRRNWQGKLIVESERKDGKHHHDSGEIAIALWYNLGFVQFRTKDTWTEERRLQNQGDKTAVMVGDYKITIERVSISDNIRKIR